MTYLSLSQIAHQAAQAAGTTDAGVCVTVDTDRRGEFFFAIWTVGQRPAHRLACAVTDLARLTAHAAGYAQAVRSNAAY